MNKLDVIAHISSSPEYFKAVKRIYKQYDEFAGDCYNDLILKVYNIDESKLVDLYNRGALLFYCIRILQYEKFWIKYLPYDMLTGELIQEDEREIDTCDIADFEICKESFKDRSDWYITKVAEGYVKIGSLRKLADKIDIPYRSLGLAVNQFRDKIVNKHKQYEVFMAKNVLNDLPNSTKEKLYLASVKQGKTPEKLMEDLINGLDKGKPKTDSGKARTK